MNTRHHCILNYVRGDHSWIYPVTRAVPRDGLAGKGRCCRDDSTSVCGRAGVCTVAIDLAVGFGPGLDDDVEAPLFFAPRGICPEGRTVGPFISLKKLASVRLGVAAIMAEREEHDDNAD